MIVRVQRGPDGRQTRTVISPERHDGQQAVTVIEKLLESYPAHGWTSEEGYWACSAEGQRYTFVAQ
jgi:hypothetical protein